MRAPLSSVRPSDRRGRQRGLSMVELMVGVLISLFVIAGFIGTFVSQVSWSRQLLIEARINQDLRAAADLIARDLRHSAYWANAIAGTDRPASIVPPRNPYGEISADEAAGSIVYSLSRDAVENDQVDANERFGFRHNRAAQSIQMQTAAGTWQTLTDATVMRIPADGFSLTAEDRSIDMAAVCASACSGGGCPRLTQRRFRIALKGVAQADPRIVREMQVDVRARNDRLHGQCPE